MCRGGRGCAAAIHHAVKASIRTAATAGPPQPPRRGAAPRRSQPLLSQAEVNLALSKLCLRVRGRSWATWHHPSGTTALSPCWWHRVQAPQGPRSPPGDPRCPRSRQELPWRCWQRVREGWGCARQHPSPQLLSGNGQQADWGRHRVAALAQRITVTLQERGGQELGWGQGALIPVHLQSRSPAFGMHQAVSPPPRMGEKRGAQPSPAKLDASRWPCLLRAGPVPSLPTGWGGVAVVVTDPPQAAGTRESPAALSFPWLSTLTFPFPSISLLPAAAKGGGLGGAAADGQPDPFLPPSLFSQPSPPQHSSGTYEYLFIPPGVQ